jgi:hypothetical protein
MRTGIGRLARGFPLVIAIVSGCRPAESGIVRGHGLGVASVNADARAHIYEAALGAAFTLGDPQLSLLIDPRLLPRTIGLEPGGAVPAQTRTTLRGAATIKGSCEPPTDKRSAPRCTATLPGYVVRFSDPFALTNDSVLVYLFAQKYDTRASGNNAPLRFEKAYQVVRRADRWIAVSEGRIPKTVRGEPR